MGGTKFRFLTVGLILSKQTLRIHFCGKFYAAGIIRITRARLPSNPTQQGQKFLKEYQITQTLILKLELMSFLCLKKKGFYGIKSILQNFGDLEFETLSKLHHVHPKKGLKIKENVAVKIQIILR